MGRFGLTIVMAILLAGLGAYLYFVELPSEREQAAQEEQAQQILPFEENQINGLTVKTGDSAVVIESDSPGSWRITVPIQTQADRKEIEGMLRALVLGKVSRVVAEEAANLVPFGLDPPSVSLTVTAGERAETLSLGNTGPISSTLYALRESDRLVLLTDLKAQDFFNKTLHALRDKSVVAIKEHLVERLRLRYPPTEIVLYRAQDAQDRKWMIRFPVETEADQPEVRNLLLRLEDLQALGFIDHGPEHDALWTKLDRIKDPPIRIVAHAKGQDQTVQFFQLDPASGEAYAITSQNKPIYLVNPMALQALNKDLFTLRSKRLLGVSADQIAMLHVKTRDQDYTLINQNGTWILEDAPTQPVDQVQVNLFVSRVADLPAELRVVKRPGPLAPYGLASPTAEFTATVKEGRQSGRLVLGDQAGGLVYAMGQGLPGLYQARSLILSQIPKKEDLQQHAAAGERGVPPSASPPPAAPTGPGAP